MFPAKFCHVAEDGEHVPHDYGNVYFEQPCGPTTRLVIGPTDGHVDLVLEMAAEMQGRPWYVLYVLLLSRHGAHQPGRYQSEPFESHAALSAFLAAFRSYFETDGRHHVWVGSPADGGNLVYDEHNVVFAYGPLERFKAVLQTRGFRDEQFWFPKPHFHGYTQEGDAEEDRLMNEMPWQYSPLQPQDEWK